MEEQKHSVRYAEETSVGATRATPPPSQGWGTLEIQAFPLQRRKQAPEAA